MLTRVRSNIQLRDLWQAAYSRSADPLAELERVYAERFGFPDALLFSYGRTALHILLTALGWLGRDVLCPAYICAEVPYAVTLSNNRVRLVDSAHDHFLPDAAVWETALTPNAAMAIMTPLFGYPLDKNCEKMIRARAPGIFILYDESQSFGVCDDMGFQMRDADGALLSLGLGKTSTALSGGVLLLRDPEIARAVRHWRDTRSAKPQITQSLKLVTKGLAAWLAFREPGVSVLELARHFQLLPPGADNGLPPAQPKLPPDPGTAFSAYQARIGLRQFARLDTILAGRQKIGQYYDRRLAEEGFGIFRHAFTPTWPRYPWAVANREASITALRRQNIQVSSFLPYSCAKLFVYRDQSDTCPNASVWGRSMINLPNWTGLEEAQAERVVRALGRIQRQVPSVVDWPV